MSTSGIMNDTFQYMQKCTGVECKLWHSNEVSCWPYFRNVYPARLLESLVVRSRPLRTRVCQTLLWWWWLCCLRVGIVGTPFLSPRRALCDGPPAQLLQGPRGSERTLMTSQWTLKESSAPGPQRRYSLWLAVKGHSGWTLVLKIYKTISCN